MTVEEFGGLARRDFATTEGDRQLRALRAMKRFVRVSDMRVARAVCACATGSVQQLVQWLTGRRHAPQARLKNVASDNDQVEGKNAGGVLAGSPPSPAKRLGLRLRRWTSKAKCVRASRLGARLCRT